MSRRTPVGSLAAADRGCAGRQSTLAPL